jgi:hypothetical protein
VTGSLALFMLQLGSELATDSCTNLLFALAQPPPYLLALAIPLLYYPLSSPRKTRASTTALHLIATVCQWPRAGGRVNLAPRGGWPGVGLGACSDVGDSTEPVTEAESE